MREMFTSKDRRDKAFADSQSPDVVNGGELEDWTVEAVVPSTRIAHRPATKQPRSHVERASSSARRPFSRASSKVGGGPRTPGVKRTSHNPMPMMKRAREDAGMHMARRENLQRQSRVLSSGTSQVGGSRARSPSGHRPTPPRTTSRVERPHSSRPSPPRATRRASRERVMLQRNERGFVPPTRQQRATSSRRLAHMCDLCRGNVHKGAAEHCPLRLKALMRFKLERRWTHSKRTTMTTAPWCPICHAAHTFERCALFDEVSNFACQIVNEERQREAADALDIFEMFL